MVNIKRDKINWKAFAFFLFSFFLIFFIFKIANYWGEDYFRAEIVNNGVVDVDDKIEVSFSQPILFLDKEDIVLIPETDFEIEISESRRNVIIEPKQNLLKERKYSIIINNVIGASGMQLDRVEKFFYTKEGGGYKKLAFSDTSQDFGEFILSENRYFPPESSVVEDGYSVEPYFFEGKYIDVDITNQVMTLFEDGAVINQFLVSSGKYGMPTPLGSFSIKSKEENHWSFSYGLWMPYSMNFYGPYYIHELPYWPSGYREGEDHLGYKVSHGCIRLGVGPAERVFNWSEIGTSLYVHK